jgi:hypothetical protein
MISAFTSLPSITNNRILVISPRGVSHSTTKTRNPSTFLLPPPTTSMTSSTTQPSSSSSRLQLSATITRDELSTMSKAEQYHLFGVESENQLALGIDVDDVLEYIGTKSDILTKFSTDLPHLATTVEQEVNKFLLDGEMLDVMIKYEQRKREDPNWDPSSQYSSSKGNNESPINTVINFVAQYGVYVVGAILVKDVVEGIMNRYNAGGG